jgi:tRNA threonylcarbamoyladenosine biosynthesis protein TsaB
VRILALECATEYCSAALWLDGRIHDRDLAPAREASEQLLQMIGELLAETRLPLQSLDLLAVGRGPGGFTGVRLAASIAQGLAYAAALPVVPVSTLRAVAQAVSSEHARVLVCQDARMGEVYWGAFEFRDGIAHLIGDEQLSRPDVVDLPVAWRAGHWVGAGSGFAAYPLLAAHLMASPAMLLPKCHPQARAIALLAAHDGMAAAVSASEVQPVYLRNNVAVPPPPI